MPPTGRRGAGEGSIYQRADGRWTGAVQLGLDADGTRQRRVVYGKTRREVADKLKALLTEQQRGKLLPANRLTVGEYLDGWLRDVVLVTVSPSTEYMHRVQVQLHLKPTLGAIRLDKLTTADIQRAFATILAGGKISANGIHSVRSTLRLALNHAIRTKLISESPMIGVVTPRKVKRELTIWTVEEARRFIDVARHDRLEAFWLIALSLGLRRSEGAALRLADVDLERGTVRVAQTLTRIEKVERLGPLKTRSSARTIVIPAKLRPALVRQLERRTSDRLLAGPRWKESGLFFTRPDGRAVSFQTLHDAFRRLIAEAGVPLIRIHDLRHTCASMLLAQGVPARAIMDLLGHAQIATTMDIYAHIMPELKRQPADIIDRIMGDDEPNSGPF